MDEIIKPSIQAFLVCDTVICEVGTNKKTIVGTFTHVKSANFPVILPQIGLYLCITDAEGSYVFEVELYSLDGAVRLGGGKLPKSIEINDRLAITDAGISLKNVLFPAPGRYEFQLKANGHVIATKDFTVIGP